MTPSKPEYRSPDKVPTHEYDRIWALGALALAVAAVCLWFGGNDRNQAIAAWVQAIGSIAAIIGSLAMARNQARDARLQMIEATERERRDRLLQIDEMLEIARRRASRVLELMIEVEDPAWNASAYEFPMDNLVAILAALNEVSLLEIRDLKLLSPFVGAVEAIRNFDRCFGEYREKQFGTGSETYAEMIERMSGAMSNIDLCTGHFAQSVIGYPAWAQRYEASGGRIEHH